MQKETFRVKGLSNRGPARCPFDDAEAETLLVRDILLTLAATMVLSAGLLATAGSGYLLVSKLPVLALSGDWLVIGSLAGLMVTAVLTLVCGCVYLCGVLHIKDPEINTATCAILSCFTVLLAASSGTSAVISRANIPLTTFTNTTKHLLLDSAYKNQLVTAMTSSMTRYVREHKTRRAWDGVQTALQCCGVNNAIDWLPFQGVIPSSCCRAEFCPGCVNPVAADVASLSSSTAAACFILTVVMIVSTIICGWLWRTKVHMSPPPIYSIEVIPIVRPASFVQLRECSSLREPLDSLSLDSLKEEEMHVRYYNTATRK